MGEVIKFPVVKRPLPVAARTVIPYGNLRDALHAAGILKDGSPKLHFSWCTGVPNESPCTCLSGPPPKGAA